MLSLAGSYTCKAAVIRCEQSYRSVWHNNHNNLDSWSLYLLSTFISVWSSSVRWCWKLCKNLRSELWMRLFCQLQDGFIIIILYIMKGRIATNILLAQKLLKWKKKLFIANGQFHQIKRVLVFSHHMTQSHYLLTKALCSHMDFSDKGFIQFSESRNILQSTSTVF